jgi:hypothetical protein
MSKNTKSTLEIERVGTTVNIKVPSTIGDQFNLPIEPLQDAEVLHVDMMELKIMISHGLRHFLMWFYGLEASNPTLKVHIKNVHTNVANTFVLVRKSINRYVNFDSVFVPFFCPRCSLDDVTTLMTREIFFADSNPVEKKIKPVICNKCGQPMELDATLGYFSLFENPS